MYILGISSGGESGASLFKDDTLLYASNEERFSRIKLDTSFPKASIDWCLKSANISVNDISLITYGFSSGCETEEAKGELLSTLCSLDNSKEEAQIIQNRVEVETQIDKEKYQEFLNDISDYFPSNTIPIYRVNHHVSHIACAYMASGMKEALVITADGRGDYRSLSIVHASQKGIKELYHAPSWYSFGYFYGRMTKLCGFTPNRHEGKVTGLAAHGQVDNALEFVKKMIYVKEGKVISNLGQYYRPFFTNYSDTLIQEAEEFSSEDLAAATQYYLESMFIELVNYYCKKSNLYTIALAGGVFSNISLNQAIYETSQHVDIFVYPNMGDAGICVGSTYAWLWQHKMMESKKITSMYLGYEIKASKITEVSKQMNCSIQEPSDIYESAINLLTQNLTLAIAQDRAEFGPRALGNRSILASPQNMNILQKINLQLGRDSFMPLAPMIPIELASEFIEFKNERSYDKGYFMTMTYKAKKRLKQLAPAVVHVDNSVRPQFITKESNPFIHTLLMRWYQQTGCPALINTSFNAHEEPIVNNEIDAISALKKGVVDSLISLPYLIRANLEDTL